MKSPFAPVDTETYVYPAPLKLKISGEKGPEDNHLVDQEVVAELAKPGADEVWLKLRIPRSKGDNDAIADYTQTVVSQGTNGDGPAFQQRLRLGNAGIFGLLVEGWSKFFGEEEPSGAAYSRLDMWTGVWVDACLGDVMAKGQASIAKKVLDTSKPRRTSRAGSTAGSE
jgi:hypothetical protein